jgi:hypothetical protein
MLMWTSVSMVGLGSLRISSSAVMRSKSGPKAGRLRASCIVWNWSKSVGNTVLVALTMIVLVEIPKALLLAQCRVVGSMWKMFMRTLVQVCL